MTTAVSNLLSVANKEFKTFFASPAAYLFLGAFVGLSLFVFFWVETFFSRNIADIRPLFQWFPILLIFLVSALTMRSWSEEKRSGTIESLLTSPVSKFTLIGGKFAAALSLVLIAMVLTLPLPLTVSVLGRLDIGPVFGGYVATFFLAASYISIGLYTSAKTDNPIVALIMTVMLCGIFYIIGSPLITSLVGHNYATILEALGTGSRFESITRGVIDLRDLVFYTSIVVIFLVANAYTLEKSTWTRKTMKNHKQWNVVTGLVCANAILLNIWLFPVSSLRADLTEGSLYSLSEMTENELKNLREPLLIRGYFSERSHPLLSPLVPRIKDILTEYEVSSGGTTTVEFVDPQKDRELEEEAATKYGVRPMPFQTASRHQAEVVNSYFDIVIAYGDQFETLSYADLIEAKASASDVGVEVRLKNPEYAITRAIKKTVGAYNIGGTILDSIVDPVTLNFYVSSVENLPKELKPIYDDLVSIGQDYSNRYKNKFSLRIIDPNKDENIKEQLDSEFNLRPQMAGLLDQDPFWFNLILENGSKKQLVQFSDSLEKEALQKSIEASLKRFAPGYLRTVTVVTPSGNAQSFNRLRQILSENLNIAQSDLKDEKIPQDTDMLLVLAPNKINDLQLKKIDQFLMKGGSVVLATSPFNVQVAESITAVNYTSGVDAWLEHIGLEIEAEMVLDPKSASLPVPVQRYIGGIPVRTIEMVPYPHFPDIRGDDLNLDHPITGSLNQITLNWASPIIADTDKLSEERVVKLIKSSASSWTSENLNVIPDYKSYPDTGFANVNKRGSEDLAVAISGPFKSYFAGAVDIQSEKGLLEDLIQESPSSAKLILISSNSFAADGSIDLASHAMSTLYTKPLEFMQNAVDWSTEDESLLGLRGKSQFARTLYPMSEDTQKGWELFNYILAIIGLFFVWLWQRQRDRRDLRAQKTMLGMENQKSGES